MRTGLPSLHEAGRRLFFHPKHSRLIIFAHFVPVFYLRALSDFYSPPQKLRRGLRDAVERGGGARSFLSPQTRGFQPPLHQWCVEGGIPLPPRVAARHFRLHPSQFFSLKPWRPCGRIGARAEVAELADALDSGSSARKGVGVQVPPSAPVILVDLPVFPAYLEIPEIIPGVSFGVSEKI